MLDKGNSVWYNYVTFYVGNGVADRRICVLRSANNLHYSRAGCGIRLNFCGCSPMPSENRVRPVFQRLSEQYTALKALKIRPVLSAAFALSIISASR